MSEGQSAREIQLEFSSAEELKTHLEQNQGALLVQVPPGVALGQFEPLSIHVSVPEGRCTVEGEVLQVIPNLGVAVRLADPNSLAALVSGAPPVDEGKEKVKGPKLPRGMGPLSWTVERIQAHWHELPLTDKIRLAKYGERPVRGMIIRGQDKSMHAFVLTNPKLTADEIAVMAGMANLDPTLLRRIASTREWLRHGAVARNLVCNPKMTLPEVKKLLNYVSLDELRRLAKTGRVRAAIKRLIIRKLDTTR